MYESLRAGKRVTLERVGTFADGVAVRRVGEETFRLARLYVDEIILVTTDQLCAAIQDIFGGQGVPSPLALGALAVAGIKKYAAREGYHGGAGSLPSTAAPTVNFDRLRYVAEARRHRRAARIAAGGGNSRSARLFPGDFAKCWASAA